METQVASSSTPSFMASRHQALNNPGLYNHPAVPESAPKTPIPTSLAIPPTTLPLQPLTALPPGLYTTTLSTSLSPPTHSQKSAQLEFVSRQNANRIKLAERKRKRAATASVGLNAVASKRINSPASNIAPHNQMPYRQYRAKQRRDPSNGQGDSVWDEELEAAFMEAVRKIPKIGRRKLPLEGKPCGRNELIAEYIFKVTGKRRTRKQVSSHIQVLKNLLRHDEAFMKCVTTDDISSSWETENTTFDIDSMGSPSAFSEPTPTLNSRPLSHFHSPPPYPPMLRPLNFGMWVAATSASGAMDGCYHTYTRLSPVSPRSIPLSSLPAWQIRFPHLADLISASELTPDIAVLHISTSVSPLTSIPPSHSLLCTQLEVSISHPSSASWECTTRIYAPSKKVLEITSSVTQSVDGRLTLPFASDFWSAFYTGLGATHPREVGKTLDGITVVQEVWESGKRAALLCWDFSKAEQGREGSSVWRDVTIGGSAVQGIVAAEQWQPLSPYEDLPGGYYGFDETGNSASAMLAAVDMGCTWQQGPFPGYGIGYHTTSQPEDWTHHLSPVSDGGVSSATTTTGF